VHQLEAAEAGARGLCEAGVARSIRLLANALGERLDEGLFEQAGVAHQRLDDLRVVTSLAGAAATRWPQQLHGAGEDPGHEGRREGQLVLDETLIEGRDQPGP